MYRRFRVAYHAGHSAHIKEKPPSKPWIGIEKGIAKTGAPPHQGAHFCEWRKTTFSRLKILMILSLDHDHASGNPGNPRHPQGIDKEFCFLNRRRPS